MSPVLISQFFKMLIERKYVLICDVCHFVSVKFGRSKRPKGVMRHLLVLQMGTKSVEAKCF